MILLASMLAYSIGAIYYARLQWGGLDILTINGWQTLLGGVFLLPILLISYHADRNSFDYRFWGATTWLALPVSIGAVQLVDAAAEKNPTKASYWLFLCPYSAS